MMPRRPRAPSRTPTWPRFSSTSSQTAANPESSPTRRTCPGRSRPPTPRHPVRIPAPRPSRASVSPCPGSSRRQRTDWSGGWPSSWRTLSTSWVRKKYLKKNLDNILNFLFLLDQKNKRCFILKKLEGDLTPSKLLFPFLMDDFC